MKVLIAPGNRVNMRKAAIIERYAVYLADSLKKKADVSFEWREGNSVISNIKYARTIKHAAENFDIVHITSQGFGYLTKHAGQRSVLTCHDLIPLIFGYGNFIQRRSIRDSVHAGRMAAVSQNTKSDVIRMLKYPGERVTVAYEGVDGIFRPFKTHKFNFDKRFRHILYTGGDMRHKNIPALFEAFRMISDREDVKLVMTGVENTTKTLATTMGLTNVVFLGYLEYDMLPHLYNSCDILVHPSLYEGFGFPPLEAMACGLPVACSNAASLPEIVDTAGLMFDPKNPGDIAEKMQTLLNDRQLSKKLSKTGLRRSKIFTWNRHAEDVMGIYEELMRR